MPAAWPFTLAHPHDLLTPEDFPTVHQAIQRTADEPWKSLEWTITGPDGQVAMTPSRLNHMRDRKAGLA